MVQAKLINYVPGGKNNRSHFFKLKHLYLFDFRDSIKPFNVSGRGWKTDPRSRNASRFHVFQAQEQFLQRKTRQLGKPFSSLPDMFKWL